MRQARIERYFSSPCQKDKPEKPSRSWLDLPLHIRKRIYAHLGLIPDEDESWGRIAMNRSLVRAPRCMLDIEDPESKLRCQRCGLLFRNSGYHYSFQPTNYCRCSPLPLHLAAVCRAADKDVKQIFYSELSFCIVHSAAGKLSALENLGPLAISSLRDLMIRMTIPLIDVDYAFVREPCHPVCNPLDYNWQFGGRPNSRHERNALADLRRVLKRLALYIEPGQLSLTFVCDSLSPKLDEKILGMLLGLPRLRSCGIAMSEDHRPHTQRLVREACLKLVGHGDSYINSPFPFRRLPHELQIQVLKRTDLVSPHHLYFDPMSNQPIGLQAWNSWNHGSVSSHCFYQWSCMRSTRSNCCHCDHNKDDESRDHSGTTYSTSCSCYHFPSALFLVDRQMEQDARRVMYMHNTWLMGSGWTDRVKPDYQARATWNLTNFLELTQNITMVCTSIRRLPEPGVPFTEWRPYHKLLRNITMIEPQRLALTIMLPHPETNHGPLPKDIHAPIWSRQLLAIRAIKELLTYGKRFRDFFVSIRGYDMGDDEYDGYFESICPETDGDMELWEVMFEKMVMGEGYDSRSRGKVGNVHQYEKDYPNHTTCTVCPSKYEGPWRY